MAIYHEEDEDTEVRLRKMQKHLRAKLLHLSVPPWFDKRLREEAGITDSDHTAILCTTAQSAVLSEEKLVAVETFIRRFEAGAITATPGEVVLDPRSPHAGLDEKALFGSVTPGPAAPAKQNGHRIQEIVKRLDEPKPAPRLTECEQRYTRIRERWLALAKPYGRIADFMQHGGFCTSDITRLNHGLFMKDYGAKYDRLERALTHFENLSKPTAPPPAPALPSKEITFASVVQQTKERPEPNHNPIFAGGPPRVIAPEPEPPFPPHSKVKYQNASIVLDAEGRRFIVDGPMTITRAELDRLRGWLEFQFIVTD